MHPITLVKIKKGLKKVVLLNFKKKGKKMMVTVMILLVVGVMIAKAVMVNKKIEMGK